ncbi:8-oxoguanine DNA glycosylase OGG fold protein [Sanguibacter suaedae]|uniref:Uncharacterized protein n=1 Tax=Sanguibacter suaedae TaxID=2795737 RepID=A0A934I0M6_9MICO|nr:hypothetical protein [Sanguibacter suaedae]MBI9113404.1 hypothetical protein [Sanguibacter suaedae]
MLSPPSSLAALLEEESAADRAFCYQRERWREWTGHLDQNALVLDDLPAELDRTDAARLVRDLLPGDVTGAFTVAMMWGHGPSGHGPFRTARILTGSKRPKEELVRVDVRRRLRESADIALKKGAVAARLFLNAREGKVDRFGPAFITVWISLITARGEARSQFAAPVLDPRISRWLAVHAISVRGDHPDDYARYVEMVAGWATSSGLAPVEVEERILRLAR